VVRRLTDDERGNHDDDGPRHPAATAVRRRAADTGRSGRRAEPDDRHAGDATVEQRVGDGDGDDRQQEADGELERRPRRHVDDDRAAVVGRPAEMTRRRG